MHKIIITLIIFCFSLSAAGQLLDPIFDNQIKLSTLRIIDPHNQGIELNYERFHSKRFSSELSAAHMGNIITSGNFEGFRIGFEEKYFFVKRRIPKVRPYVSTQLVYNNSALKNVNNYGYDSSTNTYFNVPFTVLKKTAAINIKTGLELKLGRFVLENCFGIGAKYREVKHIDRKYPYPKSKFWDRNAEGSWWVINLPATFKIGYIF